MIHIKNLMERLENKPIAVMGLGLSGVSVVRAWLKNGGRVHAWDDQEAALQQAAGLGADTSPLTSEILGRCAFLVLAPGISLTHEVVAKARGAGLEIICDIELFHRLNHGHKTIGITGTNGKSTTTALVTHILNHAGKRAVMGGNIGKPVFDLEIPDDETIFVFELSSYQLDLCTTYHPDVAVLINISPDHLDRHGDMNGYVAAKRRIFGDKTEAAIGVDDEWSLAVANDLVKAVRISVKNSSGSGIHVRDHVLFDGKEKIADLSNLPALKGIHNQQNVAAAWSVCKPFKIIPLVFAEALKSFQGLPHRQFPARIIGKVSYINDSKATNADSAARALATFDNIFWIVGGRAKAGGLEGLEIFLPKIRKSYLIGEAIPAFQRWMGRNHAEYNVAHVLQVALERAHKDAQEFSNKTGQEAVVLLSPACASFDQFKSFEKRGERFMTLVQNLKV